MDGGYYATKRIWAWLLFSPIILSLRMIEAVFLYIRDLFYVREAKVVTVKRKLNLRKYILYLNKLLILFVLALSACTKDPKPAIKYRFVTYYQNRAIDTFEMEYSRNGSELTLKADTTGYKGWYLNDTQLNLKSSSGIQAFGKQVGDSLNIEYWGFTEKGVRL